jgi:hypothetical protein
MAVILDLSFGPMHVAQQMEHGLMPFQHVHVRNMEKEAFEKNILYFLYPMLLKE